MTKHKKGNEHWTAEYKRLKAERDDFIGRIAELERNTPTVDDGSSKLIREVYDMLGSYYCNVEDVRIKIKNSGHLK